MSISTESAVAVPGITGLAQIIRAILAFTQNYKIAEGHMITYA